jgi:hypothetical protein
MQTCGAFAKFIFWLMEINHLKPVQYPDKPVVEQSWFWMSVILEARISFLQSRQIVFSDTGMIIWLPPKQNIFF